MTVLVAPTGGLGNMLFQVAAGRQLAAEQGSDLLMLPPATRRDRERRPLLWEALGRRLEDAPDRLVARVRRSARRRPLSRGVVRIEQNAAQAHQPRAPLPSRTDVVVLRGYFQHPDYFGAQAETIAGSLRDWCASAEIGPPVDLAIHLRRGDYLPLGWELPVEYYRRAIRAVSGEAGPPRMVRIVSDDRLAAEGLVAHLAREAPTWSFDVDRRRSLVEDFATLSRSRSLVMSNSTFAWWAAVVGDTAPDRSERREVVVPRYWLGIDRPALLRPEWRDLEATAD